MKYIVNNKEFDSNNNINQKIKEKFVNRNIITCQTYLINALMGNIEGFSYDNVENYFKDNSEEIEEIKEQLSQVEELITELNNIPKMDFELVETNCYNCDLENVLDLANKAKNIYAEIDNITGAKNHSELNSIDDEITKLLESKQEELENKIEELEQEQEEPQEPLEWWEINNWFADKLRQYNEPILENDYGIYWGRTTSGQAIYMDSVIDEITIEMKILEGQTNSWHEEPENPVVPDNKGYAVIDFTQFPHKDDAFLYMVLAYNSSKDEYATWIYNKNDDAFNNGQYINDKVDAFKNYAERMNSIF